MDEATIRPAHPIDVPELAALAARTWSDAFGATVAAEDEATELATGRSEGFFTAMDNERTTLVAELHGALVGYVQFGDRELHRLYVDQPLQGQGLGRRLLTAALEHPRLARADRIVLQVWDQNVRAVRLYESVGFTTCGTTRFMIGAEEMEDLVMALERG